MKLSKIILPFLALAILLSSCSNRKSQAASAVEAYLNALVDGNADQLSLLSCKDWEAQALTELDSFSAVEVNLENPACQESGTDGDMTLVTCTGRIIANYGNEILEIDLTDRTYQTLNEGGEWRMCGYR